MLVIGVASIACGVLYTGGPRPFGYSGWGDAAVFVFFGVVAVVGTDYVQTLAFSGAALWASLSIGSLATAILVVNNLRDVDEDCRAGKRTLAVRLGRRGARVEYASLLLLAYALLPIYVIVCERSLFALAPLLSLRLAISLLRTIRTREDGPSLNTALAGTARLSLIYALLLALGWLL